MAHSPHPERTTSTAPKKVVIVTHQYPDTDAWLCAWFIYMHHQKHGVKEFKVLFVNAGEGLPKDEWRELKNAGWWVETADTGRGKHDQHGKELGRTSSFEMLVRNYRYPTDTGALKAFVDLANKSDSIEEMEATSLHYILKGLPNFFKSPEGNQEVSWGEVKDMAFAMFDIIYSLELRKAQGAKRFAEGGYEIESLTSGIRLCPLRTPKVRDAAYQQGADVVVWRADQQGGGFHVGAQVNRNSRVTLERVAGAIRKAECEKRGVPIPEGDLTVIERMVAVPGGWYLHDSRKLMLCGSRSHTLAPEELTQLSWDEVVATVREGLSA